MKPKECSRITRQTEITNARIIVLRRSALFTIVMSLSAPGNADFSSLERLRPVFRSLLVYAYKADALLTPIWTI
jgi:hypothetical protein